MYLNMSGLPNWGYLGSYCDQTYLVPVSLLSTKFYVPPARPYRVSRLALVERLSEGLAASRKLTVISAPAGFGKTTLVSDWIAVCGRPVAWLSLDEGDND